MQESKIRKESGSLSIQIHSSSWLFHLSNLLAEKVDFIFSVSTEVIILIALLRSLLLEKLIFQRPCCFLKGPAGNCHALELRPASNVHFDCFARNNQRHEHGRSKLQTRSWRCDRPTFLPSQPEPLFNMTLFIIASVNCCHRILEDGQRQWTNKALRNRQQPKSSLCI